MSAVNSHISHEEGADEQENDKLQSTMPFKESK